MNGAVQTASPFLDEPWRRLAWIAPLSIAIWAAILLGFGLVLKQTTPPLPELKPIEARIVELPPVAGLQGGPAAVPHPIAPAPPKPRPHVEVRRKVIAPAHPHKERSSRKLRRRLPGRERKRLRNRARAPRPRRRAPVPRAAERRKRRAAGRDSAATVSARGRSIRRCQRFRTICARPLLKRWRWRTSRFLTTEV